MRIIIKGQDLHGCIIDGGSGVNVISETTCHNLGLNQWEPCPFWLRMADTRSVRPIVLIRHLEFSLGEHMFTISVVLLRLETQGAYPMLLGRPWLRTANIKQHWQRNMISFRRGKTKVRVITEERVPVALNTSPLYAEGVHMLDGLADEEVEDFLEDHPTIVPLFEINAMSPIEQTQETGVTEDAPPQDEPDPTKVAELRQARDAFERELAISQRVKASTLETINLGSDENPRTLQIANNVPTGEQASLVRLLTDYQDVFAWSYTDMKGLDPQYYQHQINLLPNTRPVQQRRYRMNPNYAAKVKEEIDKLLRVGFIRPVKGATWLSPIVVVPKKNGKIRVCVDYRKLNSATVRMASRFHSRIAFSTRSRGMNAIAF